MATPENHRPVSTASPAQAALDTPLREDAFSRTDAEKIAAMMPHLQAALEIMGLDMTDDSLQGTPRRIAEMWVEDFFPGLHEANRPKMVTFENPYQYHKMLVEKNIRFFSACEHHFMPIIGTAHVAYRSSGRVVGLSKINRLVKYLARRPQVQERLTRQIAEEMMAALGTEDVAVIVEAKHLCVMTRGVEDEHASTVTLEYNGVFQEAHFQEAFQRYLQPHLMQ